MKYRCLLIAGMIGVATFMHGAGNQGALDESRSAEIVDLPTFEVSGKFPADGWLYARIENTEFVSQLSKRETAELADDFAIFQEFVRAKYPEAALGADHLTTVVLCNSAAAFKTFAPHAASNAVTATASSRFIHINASLINNIPRAIRRRWLTMAAEEQPPGKYPLWREWATRELLAAVLIIDGHLEVGYTPYAPNREAVKRVRPFGAPAPPIYSAQFSVMPGDLVPLDTLFQLSRPLPSATSTFAPSMEATAFMHMCQFSVRHKKWREAYKTFAGRLETEVFSERLFQECFGKSTKEMRSLLHSYLFDGAIKYESLRYKFLPTAPFEVRSAEPVEVLRLLRECQRQSSESHESRSARERHDGNVRKQDP